MKVAFVAAQALALALFFGGAGVFVYESYVVPRSGVQVSSSKLTVNGAKGGSASKADAAMGPLQLKTHQNPFRFLVSARGKGREKPCTLCDCSVAVRTEGGRLVWQWSRRLEDTGPRESDGASNVPVAFVACGVFNVPEDTTCYVTISVQTTGDCPTVETDFDLHRNVREVDITLLLVAPVASLAGFLLNVASRRAARRRTRAAPHGEAGVAPQEETNVATRAWVARALERASQAAHESAARHRPVSGPASREDERRPIEVVKKVVTAAALLVIVGLIYRGGVFILEEMDRRGLFDSPGTAVPIAFGGFIGAILFIGYAIVPFVFYFDWRERPKSLVLFDPAVNPVPEGIRDFVARSTTSLAALGFQVCGHFRQTARPPDENGELAHPPPNGLDPSNTPQETLEVLKDIVTSGAYVALLANHERQDIAIVVAGQATGVPGLEANYVEFRTMLDDGRELATNNVLFASRTYARNPMERIVQFPRVTDLGLLYRLHGALLDRYVPGQRGQLPPPDALLAWPVQHWLQDLDLQVKAGYMRVLKPSDQYGPTLKGACVKAWLGCPGPGQIPGSLYKYRMWRLQKVLLRTVNRRV